MAVLRGKRLSLLPGAPLAEDLPRANRPSRQDMRQKEVGIEVLSEVPLSLTGQGHMLCRNWAIRPQLLRTSLGMGEEAALTGQGSLRSKCEEQRRSAKETEGPQ